MTPFRATYRLQLNKDFSLSNALDLVPYLDELGVSHVYLSPVLKAQPGSTHGYDTVDHTRINPEIGTADDFRALAGALKARSMGILLDFVPNHMGVGGADNALWQDVLRHGPTSRYADWFDIDWQGARSGMEGRLLVPFLGKSYAEVLADGDIALRVDGEEFAAWVYGKEKLPIRPEDTVRLREDFGSAETVVAAHADRQMLDALIARQHWRLAHHATAADEINYRRFFINSELAGIRIDRDEVFEHAHKLIFSLIGEGLVEGLRIDHIDGLREPLAYLRKLRAMTPRPIYLTIEKILAPHEYLRRDWPVDGTTGYETGAELTRLLTQPDGEPAVTAAYHGFVGPTPDPREEAYRCKLRVMDNELSAELKALVHQTARLAWSVAATGDLTAPALQRAWRELIAHLDVYRTYIDSTVPNPRDRRELCVAMARARNAQPHIQPSVFDFIEGLLCGTLGIHYSAEAIANIVARFQHYSGPVMAKGLEDTALYRFNRLVSLNEVGAHPDRFNRSIAAFHDSDRRRLERHPCGMIGTSTHDTKRGEDIRLIISAIADEPQLWREAVKTWRHHLSSRVESIHPNDLYLLFQLLLGGWPMAGEPSGFAARLQRTMTKSLREARLRSDWTVSNVDYEANIGCLIDAMLADDIFLSSFHAVRTGLVAIGRRKALIHTALKFTIPGVPDIYRGAEDWEQSFVDPDNRRALDFTALARRLAAPQTGRDDKLMMTQRLLRFRRDKPALFSTGSYEPLDAGPGVLAFHRRHSCVVLAVVADLSPGHRSGLPPAPSAAQTIVGSRAGPLHIYLF